MSWPLIMSSSSGLFFARFSRWSVGRTGGREGARDKVKSEEQRGGVGRTGGREGARDKVKSEEQRGGCKLKGTRAKNLNLQ